MVARPSGKAVILTSISERGLDYVLDNISELADKSLITEKYARSIVRDYVLGNIEIKKGNQNDISRV